MGMAKNLAMKVSERQRFILNQLHAVNFSVVLFSGKKTKNI